MENTNKKKFKMSMPHIFTLLFLLIVIVSALSYVLPVGAYERVEGPDGRMMLDTESYHLVENTPVSILKVLVSMPQGYVDAGWIIVLVLCIGGGFVVVRKTRIIEVVVDSAARNFTNKGIIIIPLFMTAFAVIDAFSGMCELTMVYVPLIMGLVLALGFDTLTCAAIALCGSAAGFTAALTNPATVGIAQKVSGLPLYSGIEFRIITLTVTLVIGIIYVIRYANKVRKDPTKSYVYETDKEIKAAMQNNSAEKLKATPRQAAAGIVALLIFALTIFGVLKWGWDFPEMSGMFIAMGIISGVVAGLTATEICDSFMEGFQDVLFGALVIGVARGIVVVMDAGQITDTMIHGLAGVVQGLPNSITAMGMLLTQTVFSFLVPSGSGMALITMPIMAPLADIVGITRQTAVLAFQYADGVSNILTPTCGYFMATLAIAKVPYKQWFKFMWPLFLIWMATGAVFVIIAQAIQWGPF